jgi:hypothetical protein
MTRQCAWCDRYLSFKSTASQVTHGICDRCAERVRHTMLFMNVPPRSRGLFLATKARLGRLFYRRSERWCRLFRLSGLFGWMAS